MCPDNNVFLIIMDHVWPFNSKGLDWKTKQARLRGLVFYSNLVLNEMVLISMSILWIGFSVDLIKTIQNPFNRYEQRLRTIFNSIVLVMLAFIAYLLLLQSVLPNHHTIQLINRLYIVYIRPFISLLQLLEIVISLYSLLVAFVGLCIRKGFNKEVQQTIFRKQVFLVCIRVATNLPYFLASVYVYYQFIFENVDTEVNVLYEKSIGGAYYEFISMS